MVIRLKIQVVRYLLIILCIIIFDSNTASTQFCELVMFLLYYFWLASEYLLWRKYQRNNTPGNSRVVMTKCMTFDTYSIHHNNFPLLLTCASLFSSCSRCCLCVSMFQRFHESKQNFESSQKTTRMSPKMLAIDPLNHIISS